MSIKYYKLAKDEELPDEFCAIRDVGGEPSEYTFYVPESEVDKLREELDAAKHDLSVFSREIVASKAENAKLRELVKRYHRLATGTDELWSWQSVYAELRELGIEVSDG